MSKNPTNLNLSQVKKEVNSLYNDKKRVTFSNGSKIDVDVKFRPSTRSLVVAEIMDLLQKALEDKRDIGNGKFLAISTMLIIKHFTTIQTDAKTYDELLEMSVLLHDGGYTDKIIESLDKEELEEMYKQLNEAVSTLNQEIQKLVSENEAIPDADIQ
jgi:hypothetical protein